MPLENNCVHCALLELAKRDPRVEYASLSEPPCAGTLALLSSFIFGDASLSLERISFS